ncbi:MAG: class I SAM-dependent methyltransferase [Hyphomicrobiaceae bacterium]
MRPDRRNTPLARKLKDRIRHDGPMTVEEYMAACLHDPEHGYYRTRTAIGTHGDFVTAPEIGQVFGEILGLWAAVAWQRMGQPRPCNLIELGPGRGTLMQDALRALRVAPAALSALRVRLVETSEPLAALQRATLASAPVPVTWHTHLQDVPRAPAIVLANEFLDAQPTGQAVWTPDGWRMRGVGTSAAGDLEFVVLAGDGGVASFEADTGPRRDGEILEIGRQEALMAGLAIVARDGLAGLFIDYGHTHTGFGDTLQAVRRHSYEHPLCSPGEADLTAHVDFEQAARAASRNGLTADDPISQAEFLGAHGVLERTSRLMAANPGQAAALETATARLLAPAGMGTRYHVLGLGNR